ncbi:hypothetical protein EOM39_01540 [Candidatus Gracilibacteria bacterium]|nr:hypothetical protein [Candidatus Gracilibacteria bacterium]
MNSKLLQKNHIEIYKTFFSNNDLVVSGNFNFPWGYEGISNNLSYINLKIKSVLPLKCYIGLKFIDTNNIIFNDITIYNIVTKCFEKHEYNDLNKEENKIIDLLKGEVKKLGIKKGLEINILTETSSGHSFGFSGTSSCLISYGLHKLGDYCNNKVKESEEEFKKNNYNKIISLAGKLDYISRYGNSNLHNIFFTLNGVKGISYFLFKDYISYKSLDNIKKINYKMGEIINSNDLTFPFDYYLVFSGIPTDTKQVEYYKKIEFHDNNIAKFIKNFLNKNYKYDKDGKFDIINIEKIKIFEHLVNLNKKPSDENLVDSFIQQINKYRYMIGIYEKQSSFAEDFRFYFRKNKSKPNEIVGICPNYTGKLGGGYIVVTKHGLSRDTIEKTISDLKALYPGIEIEYSSHIDGQSGSGTMVEQFLSNSNYSNYLDKNKVQYKDNKEKQYLGEYNEILKIENEGLVLDTIGNKIYYNGEKLTSKDIPTQNATIEILIILLNNIDKDISNKELTLSSYSKNKNEMLGKVILPLIKFMEEKTKEKIPLICKGSLNDFYIKLGNVNTKIGIIKKM